MPRQRLHMHFELADAVMTTRHVSCLGDFASVLIRREWSSVYEALQDCRPESRKIDATI